jgi:hypothetical protein
MAVNVGEKPGRRSRQARSREASASKLLLKRRKRTGRCQNRGLPIIRDRLGGCPDGQLALLMAVLQPGDVDAVLAYNPVTYVSLAPENPYAFNDPAAPAAWTWGGKPVEGSAADPNVLNPGEAPGLEDSHAIALDSAKCPILLISGDDDPAIGDGSHGRKSSEWSCIHAIRRLKLAGYPYPYRHLAYQSAGHQLAGPPPWSGDLAAGAHGKETKEPWRILGQRPLTFLAPR